MWDRSPAWGPDSQTGAFILGADIPGEGSGGRRRNRGYSMKKFAKSSVCAAALAVAGLAASTGAASAAGENVSGSMGLSYNTNFVSYGADVWGGGNSFYGPQGTTFAWGDIGFDFSPVTFNVGVWADINDNAPSSIGGEIQEIDVYGSLGYSAGDWSFGFTYQEWNYAGDQERIVDLSVAFDDSAYMPISLSPSLTWHFRVDGNGGQDEGSAIVLAIGPSFPLGSSPVSLSFPMGVGFFLDDNFQGGTDGGIAYGYFGPSFGVPLSFIDTAYGEWGVNWDLIYYTTDGDAIPGNVAGGFLTSSVGISVAF